MFIDAQLHREQLHQRPHKVVFSSQKDKILSFHSFLPTNDWIRSEFNNYLELVIFNPRCIVQRLWTKFESSDIRVAKVVELLLTDRGFLYISKFLGI